MIASPDARVAAIAVTGQAFTQFGDLSRFKHAVVADFASNSLTSMTVPYVPHCRSLTITQGLVLPSLREVCVSHNKLAAIDIRGLPSLRVLSATDNAIASVAGIEAAELVVAAELDRNRCKNLGSLGQCSNLAYLRCV